ncbi:MAG: hypothetical protein Q7K40_05275 [bacterium]|nr:hypothetical protein [bacterium]
MEGRKILQWGLGGIVVTLIIGYSFFVLDDFVRGPKIIIESPLDGYSTTTPVIVVSGRGVHTNNLSINGAQTPVDLSGNFSSRLILAPGYNIIEVTAKDNYARTVRVTREINLIGEHLGQGGTGGTFNNGAGAGTTTQATSTGSPTL